MFSRAVGDDVSANDKTVLSFGPTSHCAIA